MNPLRKPSLIGERIERRNSRNPGRCPVDWSELATKADLAAPEERVGASSTCSAPCWGSVRCAAPFVAADAGLGQDHGEAAGEPGAGSWRTARFGGAVGLHAGSLAGFRGAVVGVGRASRRSTCAIRRLRQMTGWPGAPSRCHSGGGRNPGGPPRRPRGAGRLAARASGTPASEPHRCRPIRRCPGSPLLRAARRRSARFAPPSPCSCGAVSRLGVPPGWFQRGGL